MVPFASPAAVERIRALRAAAGPAPGDPCTGVFNDSWATDRGYKAVMAKGLHDSLADAVEETFCDQRVLGWSLLVKWPGTRGTVVAHRDPTFVDERRFRSVGVWCAIDDTNEANGPLRVVPGTHGHDPRIRPHQATENLCPDIEGDVGEVAVPLTVTAGTAIVYDHSLVHGSGPNHTTRERVAAVGLLVPNDAEPFYGVVGPQGRVSLVAIGPEFFIDHQLDRLDVDEVRRTHGTFGSALPGTRTP